MQNFAIFCQKLNHLCGLSWRILSHYGKSASVVVTCSFHFLLYRFPVFWIQLWYFAFTSTLGFLVLSTLKPRTVDPLRNIDMFFTSVSATTVSSMSTVEMEVFSNAQLVVMTFLMFLGGEVFVSTLGLQLKKYKLNGLWKGEEKVASVSSNLSSPSSDNNINHIELGVMGRFQSHQSLKPDEIESKDTEFLKYCSVKHLGYLALAYLLVIHVFGVAFVSLYLALVPTALNVLREKGLKSFTFSVFTTVSTFASCGFIPTNENMIIFRKNSGLLLILIPQVLLGNTLFPSGLRFLIWFTGKFFKREESRFLLKNTEDVKFLHLLTGLHSSFLVVTVFGFVFIQFVTFCAMDWNSEGLSGMSVYEKVIGVLFQSVNSRHTGETVVDVSILPPAILVLFVVMMYLPPYTSYLPIMNEEDEEYCEKKKKKGGMLVENVIFSQLSYLAIFVVLICMTERQKMKEDPLNFSVFNIVLEVISAYGNVGFTMGYSCKRQIHSDGTCVDKWYGFSGRWSDQGKIILIAVMFFGRLKKFNMNGGGRAWKLL